MQSAEYVYVVIVSGMWISEQNTIGCHDHSLRSEQRCLLLNAPWVADKGTPNIHMVSREQGRLRPTE